MTVLNDIITRLRNFEWPKDLLDEAAYEIEELCAELKEARAKIAEFETGNAALRQRLVVDDAMVKRAEIAWGDEFHRTIHRESASYRCMRAALTAALANKDEPE